MLTCLFLILVASSASLLLTPIVRDVAIRIGAVDKPGGRKIHVVPVPQLGGISVILSVLLAVFAAQVLEWMSGGSNLNIRESTAVLAGAGILFLVGFYDDLSAVPAWVKFLFQSAAAAITIWLGVRIESISIFGLGTVDAGVLTIPLTFLWIVGLTNAFNLIDGLDGLASGLGIIAAATSATIFFMGGGASSDGLLLLILVGALIGFLRYNFHPASIFLGDTGSQFIGYILAVTAVTGSQKSATALPVIIPLLVFGLPILDTILSMVRRAVRSVGASPQPCIAFRKWMNTAKHMFEGDRDHVHHRLLALGFTQRSAVLTLYALAAGLSCLAILAVVAQYRNAGVILSTVIVATYIGIRKLGYEEVAFIKTGTVLRWCERAVSTRLRFIVLLDGLLITTAYWAAFLLKYSELRELEIVTWYVTAFPCILIIQIGVFFGFGLYRDVNRIVGIDDLLPVSMAVGLAVLLSYMVSVIYDPPSGISALFGIDGLLLYILLVNRCCAYKILVNLRRRTSVAQGDHVLIYGAGRRGECILRELTENQGLGLCPVGFLDDDPQLINHKIGSVRILGSSRNLSAIFGCLNISVVIVSSRKIPAGRLGLVMKLCSRHQIPVLRWQFQLDHLSGESHSNLSDASHWRDIAPVSHREVTTASGYATTV
ncbi:MAG: Undecaprenyl-phosphate alpha-N-acetylglucosaminyl 1-phosphate transferase [Nitrospira sp.]|jgi:UDP-GlcNAc:undecaprenyl-phosphate GlcNAc-1-phosphate transferase|nr:MAG: Undecaprenyl-phosphate alpha-N-acetylglucosaminyl 1-phosphate transferase [Nitrospira sp.]